MENSLYINTIRLCICANKFSYGDRLLDDIRHNNVFAVIIVMDAGESSKKKISDKCKFYNVPYFYVLNKSDVKELFNKDLSSFGITDVNLAKKLVSNLNKGGFYYEEK